MVTADFGPEIELTLFLRMRAKEIAKSLGRMYTNRRVIPLLQEIEVAGANGRVRFSTGSFEIAVSAHGQLNCRLTSRKIVEILFLLTGNHS